MSEQPAPQNSPKPETPPASSTAPMKSANAATTSSFNQILAKVQPIATNLWVRSRPTIAQGLKATIGLLQSATNQLDRQIQTDHRPAKPLNLEPVKQAAKVFWTKAQPIWAKLMGLIRSRLPADVTGKLTDRALSGIVAGFALLLLSITTHLPSGNAAPKPVVIAAKPVAPARPTAPSSPIVQQFPVDTQGSQTAFPQALTAPGTSPVSPATTPIVKPTTPATPIVQPTPIAQSASPTTTEGKGVGGSPAVAERPIAQPPIAPTTIATTASTLKPTPTAPVVRLTPNQKLLAKLQATTPVGEASRNGNRPNLLQTVNPNKAQASLQITLNPIWADLPFTQQDSVAQDLFTQAQTLRFKTLELVNGAGDVLARSPVVGNEMVVLLRN
jgi:hypothetical protein